MGIVELLTTREIGPNMIRQCPNSLRCRRQNVLAQDLRNGHLANPGVICGTEHLGPILHQDPVLSQVKLMAAVWDGGPSSAEGDESPGCWRARHGPDWEPGRRGGHGEQGPWAA